MPAGSVLVADDETHILNVVSIKLQNAGFHVLTAGDGAEAYAQAIAHRPDLIITDFQMPCLSGLELACKLYREPLTRDIPVVLLTARGFDLPGHHAPAGASVGQSAGCTAQTGSARTATGASEWQGPGQASSAHNIRRVLAKPFSPRQILSCVKELLAESIVSQ